MSHDTNAVALFCEDIREEMIGSETLVGVLPDNITVPSFPVAVPKLGVYVRIHVNATQPPKNMRVKIIWPWDGEHPTTEIDPQIIHEATQNALRDKAPLFGIISRIRMNNVLLRSSGVIRVVATVDESDVLAGILNVQSESSDQSKQQ